MKKKIVFVSNILSHITGFHLPYIKWLREQGHEVHVMTNAGGEKADFCDKLYDIPVQRSPFSVRNIEAIFIATEIMNREQYDMVHCHTPMGSVIGRLCARNIRKRGCKVLYTCHGFHFYKGSGILSWLLYYPMEKWLSHMTDCIITINEDDYQFAKKHFKSNTTSVNKINGIGCDFHIFKRFLNKDILKSNSGYGQKFLLVYAAEFSPDKEHCFFVEAAKQIQEKNPNILFLFAGRGKEFARVEKYIEKKKVNNIRLLGFQSDMPKIYQMCDVLISASKREGLPMNVIEGLACGMPAVVTNIRGHRDIIQEGQNGFLFTVHDVNSFSKIISSLAENEKLYNNIVKNARESVIKFSKENALVEMSRIYNIYL